VFNYYSFSWLIVIIVLLSQAFLLQGAVYAVQHNVRLFVYQLVILVYCSNSEIHHQTLSLSGSTAILISTVRLHVMQQTV